MLRDGIKEGAKTYGRHKKADFFHTFTSNAWKWDSRKFEYGTIDYRVYKATFLSEYEVTCYAHVAETENQLTLNGEFGVAWIDAEYENDPPYSHYDLDSIRGGIQLAEDNLLRIGIPFCSDYKFLGRNAANKKRRNDALRRMYGLEELEKAHFRKEDEDG